MVKEKYMNCLICEKQMFFKRINDPQSPLHQKLHSEEGLLFERKCFCNECWNKMIFGFELEEEEKVTHFDGISKKMNEIVRVVEPLA